MSAHVSNVRPKADKVLTLIADYARNYSVKSAVAYDTARYCLMDTLGCGFEALEYPACTKLMGPIVKGTSVPNGARVPGTQFQLDPVQAAFNIGGEPGVVEIQPADHGADVERGLHGVELALGARDLRAVRHRRARDDRAQQLGAGRVFERLEAAAQRVDQAIARGVVRFLVLYGIVFYVIGDQRQDLVGLGPDVGDMRGHYSLP